MANSNFNPFPNGFRLIDGSYLNKLFQGAVNFTAAITGGSISGVAVSSTATTLAGSYTTVPTLIAAAGATQGNATAIPAAAFVVMVIVTTSTEGVKLPAAVTGKQFKLVANPTVGNKVYPATGALIGALSTNTAYALVKNTGVLLIAIDTKHWRIA